MTEHAQIQEKISLSRESEELAARIYTAAGYLVYIQYTKPHAETLNDAETNTDFGDIIIFKPGGSNAVIEVKRLSSTNRFAFFREGGDFMNGIIVDRVDTYEKKLIKPVSYMIFNNPLTYGCIINCKGKEDWTVRKEISGNGYSADHYISKAVDCRFFKVEDKLKQTN
jgi:hypothetical protein